MPSEKDLDRLSGIQKSDIAFVLVDASSGVALDGVAVEAGKLSSVIQKRLAQNEKLIVSISTAIYAPCDAFLNALEQVKKAGANRIVIDVPGVRK